MNRKEFIKILEQRGLVFHYHGSKHDIYIHPQTGKKIPVPRHGEMRNQFLRQVLKEIPED